MPYIVQGYDDGFRGPAPVGRFPANSLGLHDLTGNAAEWVNDRYSVAPSKSVETDRIGPVSGDIFVIRGSSFLMGRFGELRTAFRTSAKKAGRTLVSGWRDRYPLTREVSRQKDRTQLLAESVAVATIKIQL